MKMIDPPSGWKYGFPKPIPDEVKDIKKWLVDNGYPQEEIDEFGEHFYCRYWDDVPKLGSEDVPKLGNDVEDYINKRLENLEGIRNQLVEDNMPHNATQSRIDELLSLKHQIFQQNDVKGGELATFKNDVREVTNEEIGFKRWEDFKEFNKMAQYPTDCESPYADGFTRGAKWMREQLVPMQKSNNDIRKDKLETLAKLLAKSWFYGNWDWETPNERIMQMIMQDLGLYPFKSEDEMIQQTRVDDNLYKEAVDKVELRNPRIMPVENDVREDDVNKLAEKYPYGGREGSKRLAFIDGYWEGYNKAKENTYTEEQVRDLFEIAQLTKAYGDYKPYTFEEAKKLLKDGYLQSLKQPK